MVHFPVQDMTVALELLPGSATLYYYRWVGIRAITKLKSLRSAMFGYCFPSECAQVPPRPLRATSVWVMSPPSVWDIPPPPSQCGTCISPTEWDLYPSLFLLRGLAYMLLSPPPFSEDRPLCKRQETVRPAAILKPLLVLLGLQGVCSRTSACLKEARCS